MRAVEPTDRCHSTADLRRLAMRRVPRAVFDYVDGAAEGEWTLARNSAAFESYCLIPRYLRDVSKTNIATRVLGAEIDMPVVLAPVAMNKLFHRDGECAVARAAGRAGTVF